jgi:hypothetical protein
MASMMVSAMPPTRKAKPVISTPQATVVSRLSSRIRRSDRLRPRSTKSRMVAADRELSAESRLDMVAANKAATRIPRTPAGRYCRIKTGMSRSRRWSGIPACSSGELM